MRRSGTLVATLLLGIALVLSLSPGPRPLRAQGQQRCFAETGFCANGRILGFWDENGGLSVFGLPIVAQASEAIEGQSLETQWFERNRLELHPENQRPYDVLLGRLGDDRLRQQGRDWQGFPKSAPQAGCRFFAETGHNLCGRILEAWRANGLEFDGRPGISEGESLALFGLPLSDAQVELIEGREYTVQWFERARFELHPENQRPYDVLLGRLGSEIKAPPAPTPTTPQIPGADVSPTSPTLSPTSPTLSPTSPTLSPTSPTLSPTSPTTPSPTSPATPSPTSPPAAANEKIAFLLRPKSGGGIELRVMNTDGSGVKAQQTGRAPDSISSPAWSADGRRIIFTSKETAAARSDIYMMNADGGGIKRMTRHETDETQASWAPNPSSLVFASNQRDTFDIFKMAGDGDDMTPLTSGPAYDQEPTWSPDGRIAFISNRDGAQWDIFVMEGDGSGLVNRTRSPASDRRPVWSPDKTRIAFYSNRDGADGSEIYLMNADGSGLRRLTDVPGDDKNPTWSPDGSKIAFQSRRDGYWQIYVMNADGSGQTNLTRDPGVDAFNPAWSPVIDPSIPATRLPDNTTTAVKGPSGHIAYTLDGEIYVMSAGGTNFRNITQAPDADDYDPAWSPDGKRLVFTSKRDNNVDLYIISADGSGLRRLTSDPAVDADADWSRDGSRIVFTSDRLQDDAIFGNRNIYVMSADGGEPTRLTSDPAADEAPAWSPDGGKIAFQSNREGRYEIFLMDASGNGQRNLSRDGDDDMQPAWSPDSKYIAFMSNREGNEEIYVMNANDGSGQTNLNNSPADERLPAWAR
ncbi:MAG: hypothetical protein HGA45_32425 [Chloroflexales bacterium]|nr:hypothetical protein [Chloroflexales bacterium]